MLRVAELPIHNDGVDCSYLSIFPSDLGVFLRRPVGPPQLHIDLREAPQ